MLPSLFRVPKGFRVIVESEGTYGKAKNHAQICVKYHWRSKPREINDLEKAKIWTNFDPKLTHFACPIGLVSVFPSQCRVSKGFRVIVESKGTYGTAKTHAHIHVKHHWRSKAREKNDREMTSNLSFWLFTVIFYFWNGTFYGKSWYYQCLSTCLSKKILTKYPTRATGGLPNLRGQNHRFWAITESLYKNCVFLGQKALKLIGCTLFYPSNPKKVPVFCHKHWILHFLRFSKKISFFGSFFTKTTVLTSILTSEVTDIPPKPQSELGNLLGTQSGTWGNLVPHMCKSQQTTPVKS